MRKFTIFVLLIASVGFSNNPQVCGWLCLAAGSTVHSSFFRIAVHVYGFFATHNTNEPAKMKAMQGKALAHMYIWECEEASNVLLELFPKQTEYLSFTDLILQGGTMINQIMTIVDLAGNCHGDTFQATRIANETAATIKQRSEKLASEVSLNDDGKPTFLQLVSMMHISKAKKRINEAGPYYIISSIFYNKTSHYTNLIQNLTEIQFSDNPASLFVDEFRRDSISAAFGIWQLMDWDIPGLLFTSPWIGRVCYLLATYFAYYYIDSERTNAGKAGINWELLKRYQETKNIPKRLGILERLRLNIIEAPYRPEDIRRATAVLVVAKAVEVFTTLGNVQKVDYLTQLLHEMALSFPELVPPLKRAGVDFSSLSHRRILSMVVSAPADARLASGEISDMNEYRRLIQSRKKPFNVTEEKTEATSTAPEKTAGSWSEFDEV